MNTTSPKGSTLNSSWQLGYQLRWRETATEACSWQQTRAALNQCQSYDLCPHRTLPTNNAIAHINALPAAPVLLRRLSPLTQVLACPGRPLPLTYGRLFIALRAAASLRFVC